MLPYFIFLRVLAINIFLLGTQQAFAQQSVVEESAAKQAAEGILRSFSGNKFKAVWDESVSKIFKDQTSENLFLSQMSIGRNQFGQLSSLTIISVEYSNYDVRTGYSGDIYAITFRSKYTAGEFFERVVVVKDLDRYKLAGLFGSPVPK